MSFITSQLTIQYMPKNSDIGFQILKDTLLELLQSRKFAPHVYNPNQPHHIPVPFNSALQCPRGKYRLSLQISWRPASMIPQLSSAPPYDVHGSVPATLIPHASTHTVQLCVHPQSLLQSLIVTGLKLEYECFLQMS